MKIPIALPSLSLLLILFAACGGGDASDSGQVPATAEPSAENAGGMEGMPGMGGMEGMPGMGGMQGSGMMEQMQAHMQAVQGASADSLQRMLPMHRQMVANMIAEMNREMRSMNMSGDPAWNATVDSLRQDLVRLPEMGGGELEGYMPRHRDRVTRLMEMHRQMMQNMQM